MRTGDRLQIEMIEGGVRLRLAGQTAKAKAAPPAPAPAVDDQLPAKPRRGRPRKQIPVDPPVVAEPPAELPLQPVKVRTDEEAAKPAAASKRASRGLFSGLRIGGRRKSQPAGAA